MEISIIGILLWILFGAIIGGIAQFLGPGKQNLGWIATILLGIAGSFVGGFLGNFFSTGEAAVTASGVILSIVGATILLAIYVMATKRAS